MFRRALLATLQRFAAPRWNKTAKHAWEMAYNRADIMIEAAPSRLLHYDLNPEAGQGLQRDKPDEPD